MYYVRSIKASRASSRAAQVTIWTYCGHLNALAYDYCVGASLNSPATRLANLPDLRRRRTFLRDTPIKKGIFQSVGSFIQVNTL